MECFGYSYLVVSVKSRLFPILCGLWFVSLLPGSACRPPPADPFGGQEGEDLGPDGGPDSGNVDIQDTEGDSGISSTDSGTDGPGDSADTDDSGDTGDSGDSGELFDSGTQNEEAVPTVGRPGASNSFIRWLEQFRARLSSLLNPSG